MHEDIALDAPDHRTLFREGSALLERFGQRGERAVGWEYDRLHVGPSVRAALFVSCGLAGGGLTFVLYLVPVCLAS